MNRLAKFIGFIVSLDQSDLIKSIKILDSPFLLNEVVAWCKASKNPLWVFKVDFEEVYDSLSWEYLHEIMLIMGFGSIFQFARASVLVNGSLHWNFKFREV